MLLSLAFDIWQREMRLDHARRKAKNMPKLMPALAHLFSYIFSIC